MPVSSNQKKAKKYKRLRRLLRAVVFVLLLWLWQVTVVAMVINAYGQVDRAQAADVIIVLGAGLRRDNTPGPALTRRTLHAATLWQQGLAPVIICTGGKPGNRSRAEADACVELLLGQGVPVEAILKDDQSRSTEENALYTKVIMDGQGWHTAIIVSDSYHLFRANHLFANEGIQVYTSPVTEGQPSTLEYAVFVGREIVALHWQLVKELFNLPITYVQSI